MTLSVRKLSPIGVELVRVEFETLLRDKEAPGQLLGLLEEHGVLLLRGVELDDFQQVAFSRLLGNPIVRDSAGWSREHPGIYKIAFAPDANEGVKVKGTFNWHIDGAPSFGAPNKASILTAWALSDSGGETQFSSTYGAYERLSAKEKTRYEGLTVWHSAEAAARRVDSDEPPEVMERLRAEGARLHPLVWTHRSGRKSLVIGATASHVEGWKEEESQALLDSLLERATKKELVYSHDWQVGDMVVWDNRGLLHRVEPYGEDSGREMHRVTLEGEEPIQ